MNKLSGNGTSYEKLERGGDKGGMSDARIPVVSGFNLYYSLCLHTYRAHFWEPLETLEYHRNILHIWFSRIRQAARYPRWCARGGLFQKNCGKKNLATFAVPIEKASLSAHTTFMRRIGRLNQRSLLLPLQRTAFRNARLAPKLTAVFPPDVQNRHHVALLRQSIRTIKIFTPPR